MNFHKFIRDKEGWATLAEEEKYSSPHLGVFAVKVRTPTRPEGCPWTTVHRKGAVVIAPITANGDLLLIRQERIPVRETLWECPAGQIEENAAHDETTIRDAALRELQEETGWELAGELIPLGLFFSSPGFTDEHAHLFLARPVVEGKSGPAHDENEAIVECRAFAPAEIRRMIAGNEIRDANTLAVYARLSAMGLC